MFPGLMITRRYIIRTAELSVPESSLNEVGADIEKSKKCKSSGSEQIPAELCSEMYKLIRSTWNKEEMPQQWTGYIIAPIYKRGDKTDCNKYRGISLSSPACKILSKVLLATPNPCTNEITVDPILYILQAPEKKWEYNETVHQLFIDFKVA